MNKTILHLCADIGSDSEPYREAGGAFSIIERWKQEQESEREDGEK